MRTRVKICGITRTEDVELAVGAGVDALGLVFYDKSPRFITNQQAVEISQAIPSFVSCVALFKDADERQIESVLNTVNIDVIQFHGSETVEFCEQFSRPYIKALGMKGANCDVNYLFAKAEKYHTAKALLLDSHAPGEAGGTGEVFDWSMLTSSGALKPAIILAGGLTPDNVKSAIEVAHPYAVDISSGVESSPGIKDKTKVDAFMQQIATADEEF
jgi:phosphoribosylanthranilate isomerase